MKRLDKKIVKISDLISIEVSVFYDLGNKQKLRGYYLAAFPVSQKEGWSVYCGGYDTLLLECLRQSKNRTKQALDLAQETENELIRFVCEQKHISLDTLPR